MKNDSPLQQPPLGTEPESLAPPRQPRRGGRGKYILIAAAVVVVGGGLAAFALSRDQANKQSGPGESGKRSDNGQKAGDSAFAQQYLQGCKDREVSFTSLPMAADRLAAVEPMGKMLDGHVTPTDHVYISGKGPAESDDVLMPADGTVVQVGAMPAQYIGDRQVQTAAEDHRVVIAHNCRYVSIFIHVHKLSDALAAAVGGPVQPNSQKQISLELKAGDKLGKIGQSVDWTLADAKSTLPGFITPKLYEGEPWKVHTIDPVAIYAGVLKDQMIAASLRDSAPYGGKIDYDKPGALVGNWFRDGTNGYAGANRDRYYDGHLSIAPNHLDPSATMVSLGNWQGKAAQFAAKAGTDPAAVTKAAGAVKYELVDQMFLRPDGQQFSGTTLVKGMKLSTTGGTVRGTVMLQVLDGEKLKVETFPGKTAAQVTAFTPAAQTYVR